MHIIALIYDTLSLSSGYAVPMSSTLSDIALQYHQSTSPIHPIWLATSQGCKLKQVLYSWNRAIRAMFPEQMRLKARLSMCTGLRPPLWREVKAGCGRGDPRWHRLQLRNAESKVKEENNYNILYYYYNIFLCII